MFKQVGFWCVVVGVGLLFGTANLFVSQREKKDLDGYRKSVLEGAPVSPDMRYAKLNQFIRRLSWLFVGVGSFLMTVGFIKG